MKKPLKTVLASMSVATVIGAFAPNANASGDILWTLSPDGNTLAGSVTVVNGVAQFNGPDATQPQGIFGAGFTTYGTNFTMNFDADLKTWDSYNAPGSTPFSGWWDAFIVTVSTDGFYWNTTHTDPMPSSASTFVWGGTNYGDKKLEGYKTAIGGYDTISLSSATPTKFWVSLVLDTKSEPNTDTAHPSYGSFHVSVVPEPETYAMLLAGLGLIGFTARRRKSNA